MHNLINLSCYQLGDFGLARPGSMGNTTHSVDGTKNAAGTSAYMAPEAHRGDVSVKLDVFSFGVVCNSH